MEDIDEKIKFVEKAILKIKAMNEKSTTLYNLGVDIMEVDMGIDLVVDSFEYIFNKSICETISWWIWEDVEKNISVNGKEYNVETLQDLLKFIHDDYNGIL
jgi:hypothetical protein